MAALSGYVLSETNAESLAMELLKLSKHDRSLIFVAASIVNSMPSRDPQSPVYQKVSNALKTVIPPTRMTDVSHLVAAKDLAAKHVKPISQENYNVREAAACIRLLSRIGNERCYNLLKAAVEDPRLGVHKALIQSFAWSTDSKRYAETLLRRVTGIVVCYPVEGLFVEGVGYVSVSVPYTLPWFCQNIRVVAMYAYNDTPFAHRLLSMPKLNHLFLLGEEDQFELHNLIPKQTEIRFYSFSQSQSFQEDFHDCCV